jgi:hypothetical protein
MVGAHHQGNQQQGSEGGATQGARPARHGTGQCKGTPRFAAVAGITRASGIKLLILRQESVFLRRRSLSEAESMQK